MLQVVRQLAGNIAQIEETTRPLIARYRDGKGTKYYRISSGFCESDRITSKAECEAAVKQLYPGIGGLPTRANQVTDTYLPPYCSLEVQGSGKLVLWLNKNGNSLSGGCGPENICICKETSHCLTEVDIVYWGYDVTSSVQPDVESCRTSC